MSLLERIRRVPNIPVQQAEIIIDNPHPLLDNPATIEALAKRVYQVATDQLATRKDHWAHKESGGAKITARSKYICLYVNNAAIPLVEKELGIDETVEYFAYVQSKSGKPLVLEDRRYPEQSFLIARTRQAMYLLDFQYLQVTEPQKPPPRRMRLFSRSSQPSDSLPDCMVIRFTSEPELNAGLDRHRINPDYRHFYTDLFHPDTEPRPSYGYQRYDGKSSPLKKFKVS